MNNDQESKKDPTIWHGDQPPADPSNTSHIGQKVEQEIVSKTEGITEQSNAEEDEETRNSNGESLISEEADKYIRHPSPESRGE